MLKYAKCEEMCMMNAAPNIRLMINFCSIMDGGKVFYKEMINLVFWKGVSRVGALSEVCLFF